MKQLNIMIAVALLTAALFLFVALLLFPQQAQVVLETGQEVLTKNNDFFTVNTTIILILCSFAIGASATYIFYNSEKTIKAEEKAVIGNLNAILPLLKEDEKKAVHLIKEKGEILQNDLVLKLGLSKVKTSRLISSLERKQLIVKSRHGMTNSIKLRH
jgi:uncharacterized membrane protein